MFDTRSKPFIYVEFLGVQGSGKSTISDALTERLRRETYTVVTYIDFLRCGRVARRVFPIIYACTRWNSLRALLKFALLFFRIIPLRRVELTAFYWAVKIYLIRNYLLRVFPGDIYIFDEASLNQLLTVNPEKISRIDLQKLFQRIFPFPSGAFAVVSVTTPSDIVIPRVHGDIHAGRPHIVAMGWDEAREFYQYRRLNQGMFLHVLREGGFARCVEVEGTLPPDENVNHILAGIGDLLRRKI